MTLDLADHVIADARLRVPTTAADSFDVLREAGTIEPALAESLVEMARFRNLLVHDYVRLDAARVFEIAETQVADIRRFAEIVRAQL